MIPKLINLFSMVHFSCLFWSEFCTQCVKVFYQCHHSADIVTTKNRFWVFWAEQNSDHNNFFFLLTIWTEFPPEFYSNSHCESWGSWLQLMVIVLDRYIQVLFYLSTWLWADFKGSFKLSPLCSGKYCSRSLWSPSSIPLSTCSAFNYKIICDTW